MARPRGGAPDAYTFDLEPEGDPGNGPDGSEDLVAAPVSRTAHPASSRRGGGRRRFGRGSRAASEQNLLIDLDVGLEPDAGRDPSFGLPAGASSPQERGERPGWRDAVRRIQGFLRGRRLVAAVVLVAVALAAVVVDTVSDRGRIAALRESPGGVLDLSTPPRELWRHDTGGAGMADELLDGFAALEGGLVVTLQDNALMGIDVEDGDVRWQVELADGETRCGPGMDPWSGALPETLGSRVVCVTVPEGSGDGAVGTVTVVDSDGEVLASRETDSPHDLVTPGPEGGLLVGDWVGEVPDRSPGLPAADDIVNGSARVDDGYDLRVRLEDAATGEKRWQRTVPFDSTVDTSVCVDWSDDGLDAQVNLHGGIQALVRGKATWVSGCGIDAWIAAGGARLDEAGDQPTYAGFMVESLPSGGYVAMQDPYGQLIAPDSVDRLMDADGTQPGTVDGRYLVPQSTDGGGDDVQLVRRGSDVVALDADGERLWSADVPANGVPVRTGQVAIVIDAARALHGLDLGTGEELWVRKDLFSDIDAASLGFGPRAVESAFTDGRMATLVVTSYGDDPEVHWFAVDVTTGEDLWQLDMETDGDWGTQVAVDGRLVRWTPTAIVGLG